MTRFLSRDEWPLVLAGVAAGLIAAILMIYLFVTGFEGGPVDQTPLVAESDTVAAVADTLEQSGERGGRAPVIGAREIGIQDRLDLHRPSATPLRGPLTIRASNIVLNEESGTRFARAERITARLDMAAMRRGDVVLENVVVQRPVVALRESGGSWNYEQVFAELLEGDGGGAGGAGGRTRLVQLRNVRIENGDITATRPVQRLAFRNVQGELPLVVFSQQGVAEPYMRTSRLSLDLYQLEPEPIELAVEVRDGLVLFPEGTVRFDIAEATIDGSRFANAEGVWNPADPGYGVTATGRAVEANVEDFLFMLPETFPRTGLASFDWAVEPTETGGTRVALSDLDARTGDTRVAGAVSMRIELESFELLSADLELDPLQMALVEEFMGRELPYDGSVAGSVTGTGSEIRFDLVATLTAPTVPQPFQTGLTGSVRSTATGFVIRQLAVALDRVPLAALRPLAPGMPLEGLVTGTVALRGSPEESPLAVDVRLELGTGVALVEGMLDLTGAVASYDLSGRLVGVNLQTVLEPDVPPLR